MYQQLRLIVGEENIKIDEPMSKHTTFNIGGAARYFLTVANKAELQAKKSPTLPIPSLKKTSKKALSSCAKERKSSAKSLKNSYSHKRQGMNLCSERRIEHGRKQSERFAIGSIQP